MAARAIDRFKEDAKLFTEHSNDLSPDCTNFLMQVLGKYGKSLYDLVMGVHTMRLANGENNTERLTSGGRVMDAFKADPTLKFIARMDGSNGVYFRNPSTILDATSQSNAANAVHESLHNMNMGTSHTPPVYLNDTLLAADLGVEGGGDHSKLISDAIEQKCFPNKKK
jgi:hypothetical protein